MKILPDNVTAYKRTPEFSELKIPKGILKAHSTKKNVWGKIVVLEGKLQYTINEPELEVIILTASNHGVVEPQMLHEVKPLGKVRFYVEFYQ